MDGIVLIDGNCRFCCFASKLLKRMVTGDLPVIPETSFTDFILPDIESIKWVVGHDVYVKSDALSRILVNAHWYFQPLRCLLAYWIKAMIGWRRIDYFGVNRWTIVPFRAFGLSL
jgi:predicted DCC family thiol-disulfide oxidoreductase YuxK